MPFCIGEGACTASYCGACGMSLKEQTRTGLERVSKDVFVGLFLRATATRLGAAATAQAVLLVSHAFFVFAKVPVPRLIAAPVIGP